MPRPANASSPRQRGGGERLPAAVSIAPEREGRTSPGDMAESYVVDRPIRNLRAKLQTSDRFVLTAEGAAHHALRPDLAQPRLG